MGTAAGSGSLERRVLPISQPLLDLFYDLAQLDQEKQLEATSKLITALHETTSKSDIALESNAEEAISESLKYTLQRLVKGLASNRGGVRYGFAATLAVFLQEFPQIRNEMVLVCVDEHLKVEDMKTDCRTAGVGRLFAYKALTSSQRISSMSAVHARHIVDDLCALESRKSYLKAGASDILVEIIEKISSETFNGSLLPLLKEHLAKSFENMVLDDLFLILRAFQYHRKAMEPLLKQTLGASDLLSATNIDAICTLLYKTDTHNLHPCVLAVVTAYQSVPDRFPAFWTRFVQIAAGEAPFRAKLPFDVICKLLPFTTDAKALQLLLTQPFLVLLLRYAEEPRAAESESFKVLHASANQAKIQVLKSLKTLNDERLTQEIVDELILPDMLKQQFRQWAEFVRIILLQLEPEKCLDPALKLMDYLNCRRSDPYQLPVLRMLGHILNRIRTVESVAFFEKLIEFFAKNAYSKAENEEKKKASASLAKELATFLSWIPNENRYRGRARNEDTSIDTAIRIKVAVLEIIAQGSDYVTSDGEETDQQLKHKALHLAKKMGKLPVNDTFKSVLKLIALFAGGHWLSYRPVLAREVVEELSKMEKSLRKELTDDEVMLIIMRFVVSMLAVERTVFDTFELVFHALCPFLNGEAIALLLEMANPPVEEEDDDMEEGSVEFVSTDDEEEEFSDIGEEDGGDEENTLTVDRAALQQIPGMVQDDAEESEPDLDDEAMFQMDAVLANILRARRSEKSQEDTDPRIRALRLLTIYATFASADPTILLSLIQPMMALAVEKPPSAKSSQREQHSLLIHSVGKILTGINHHKLKDVENVEVKRKDLSKLLEECVESAGKVHNPTLHKAFVEGVLFVQRLLVVKFLKDVEYEERAKIVGKVFAPLVVKFAETRSGEFSFMLIRRMMQGLGQEAGILIPGILDIITDFEGAFAVMRQSQLVRVVQDTMKHTTPRVDEVNNWLGPLGTSVLRLLKEGNTKKRKLMTDLLDFVRFVLQWRRKVVKRGVKVDEIATVWDVVGMRKACQEMVGREEMKAKEMSNLRKRVELVEKALKQETGAGNDKDEPENDEEEEDGEGEEEEGSANEMEE